MCVKTVCITCSALGRAYIYKHVSIVKTLFKDRWAIKGYLYLSYVHIDRTRTILIVYGFDSLIIFRNTI